MFQHTRTCAPSYVGLPFFSPPASDPHHDCSGEINAAPPHHQGDVTALQTQPLRRKQLKDAARGRKHFYWEPSARTGSLALVLGAQSSYWEISARTGS